MNLLHRRQLLLSALGLLPWASASAQPALAAPNIVVISPKLVTSGQPTVESLAQLGKLGFEAVVYLAPSTVGDAVKDEPDLLARQGIEFVHIPIPFNAPTSAYAEAVSTALSRLSERKVLVHCQVNMRASAMVFLHRVIQGREEPGQAYEAVARVWSPGGVWRRLMVAELARHGVRFDPY